MPDHFVDDEAQEFFGEIGIELGVVCQLPQAFDLFFFPRRVGGGQAGIGFVFANGLRHLEPFGEHENQSRIDIVDAVAVPG